MTKEIPEPYQSLTQEQQKIVAKLSDEDIKRIDDKLLSESAEYWRKVARVVGMTLMDLESEYPEIPESYYADRLKEFVVADKLESRGNLDYLRFSEVRLKSMSNY